MIAHIVTPLKPLPKVSDYSLLLLVGVISILDATKIGSNDRFMRVNIRSTVNYGVIIRVSPNNGINMFYNTTHEKLLLFSNLLFLYFLTPIKCNQFLHLKKE